MLIYHAQPELAIIDVQGGQRAYKSTEELFSALF